MSATVDLDADETKLVNMPVRPFDFVLDGIAVTADGPVLLKIDVQASEPATTPVMPHPGDYLSALMNEYPAHLATAAGETVEEWEKTNAALAAKALIGDDEAFLELVGRDPRVLGSMLTVANVVRWRTDIERYTQFYRIKPSVHFEIPGAGTAKAAAEEARKKLRRLGEVQIAAYDQRGKNLLPPVGAVKGFYYAFLCLVGGLKREFTMLAQELGERTAYQRLIELAEKIAASRPAPTSFAVWVARAAELTSQLHIGDHPGLTTDGLPSIVGPRSAKPSETALALTAELFEIGSDTVDRLKDSDTVIPWQGPDGVLYAIGGRPAFRLIEFEDFRPMLKEPAPPK